MSPAFVLLKAADAFRHPTRRPNELWQTDFTYLKVVGWGWYDLSTVLDDYSRYILAWTLPTTMQATDVMAPLDLARAHAGVDQVHVVHRPRLLRATTGRATCRRPSGATSRSTGSPTRAGRRITR
jgi:putative transposase